MSTQNYINMQKSILFLGDSFTFGEGLELYCDTPKWIAERNERNGWLQLMHKQDEDGIKFREENRFPALVAKYFNKKALVSNNNGGCIAAYKRIGQKFLLDPDLNIDTIIVQFSAITREPLHASFTCMCDFCKRTGYFRPYEAIYSILKDIQNRSSFGFNEIKTLEMFEEMIQLDATDAKFLDRVIEEEYKWSVNILDDFLYHYIQPWTSNGKRKFYFIDSWVEGSHTCMDRFIQGSGTGGNLIPLFGKDDNLYLRWNEWEDTFEHKRIQWEFPKTQNGHPTLEQHRYLAKSIVQKLKEDSYE